MDRNDQDEEYELEMQEIPLTELEQYQGSSSVDICVMDTVVLPVREDDSRETLFRERRWASVQLSREKLRHMKFAAFYLGAPTSAITHYARIRAIALSPEDEKKQLMYFDEPQPLRNRLEWNGGTSQRMTRPRYTMLKLLLEARSIEELF